MRPYLLASKPTDSVSYRSLPAAALPRPDALFSNSDHLQAQTAGFDYIGEVK
jgi:hypothetical protein